MVKLSFEEISGIIKVCSDCAVAELKYGSLSLKFHSSAEKQYSPPNVNHFIQNIDTPEQIITLTESDEEAEEYKRAQELINDPESHEAMMIDEASKE